MKISRDDGRIQQPLILVFFSPISCNTKLRMLYSRLMRLWLPSCDQLKIVKSNNLTRRSLEGKLEFLPTPTNFVDRAILRSQKYMRYKIWMT